MIISFILMTCLFDQLVILLGEIRCLSLLGLKGLIIDRDVPSNSAVDFQGQHKNTSTIYS